MTDLKSILRRLRKLTGERTFGAHSVGQERSIRHGYLLALEELERALDEDARATLASSSPRNAA